MQKTKDPADYEKRLDEIKNMSLVETLSKINGQYDEYVKNSSYYLNPHKGYSRVNNSSQ